MVQVGKKIKDFKFSSSEGAQKLSDYKDQYVVLYFYPKDNTPGCTVESVDFNDRLAKFKKMNAVVLGLSRDSLKSHDKFICKFDFKFPLISDESEEICQIFDVIKEKNMYGRKVMGIERSTFIIGPGGVLLEEHRKVKAEGHAEFILNQLKALTK